MLTYPREHQEPTKYEKIKQTTWLILLLLFELCYTDCVGRILFIHESSLTSVTQPVYWITLEWSSWINIHHVFSSLFWPAAAHLDPANCQQCHLCPPLPGKTLPQPALRSFVWQPACSQRRSSLRQSHVHYRSGSLFAHSVFTCTVLIYFNIAVRTMLLHWKVPVSKTLLTFTTFNEKAAKVL